MGGSKDVITRHIEAFNARDHDAEPWAADAQMVTPVASVSGRNEVLAFLSVFQEAFPDGRLAVKQLLAEGPAAAAEGSFVGRHDGVLHTPNGDVEPTGKPIEFRWAAVYEVDGEELISEHLFFDQMDLLGQLGLVPA